MNKKIIFLLLMTACANHLTAQKNKSELNWQDFLKSTSETKIATSVPYGKFTTFQISDINKFLYKVQIEGTVFELQTPVPTELQTLFRIRPEDLEKTATNQKSKEAVDKTAGAIEPMKLVANNAQYAVQDNTTKIKGLIENAMAPKDIEAAKKEKQANVQLVSTAQDLVSQCEKYLELAKQVSNDVFKLKATRNKLVSIAQMDVAEEKITELVTAVEWPIPDIESNYNSLRQLYKQLDERYEELKAKAKAAQASDEDQEAIQSSLQKIEDANDLIEEEALLGLISDVDFLYAELNNPNNFKAIAPPVQMDGDMVAYTVTITPSSTRTLGAYRSPVTFQFEIPTKGGLKVDFSVGPMVSFGKNARDEKYFIEDVSGNADMVTLKERSNNNKISPTIAAMMHFYSRGAHLGGMIGIGAGFQSTETLNANLFAGPSYIMGKRQKLMLSAGISYLQVQRLKTTEFVTNQQYKTSKIDLSAITEKVYKPSFFLSLSYNLTSKVEIK